MIKTENLTKIFRTEEVETVALNGVSINVDDGEFVAIMGPSGCGKSTLLNILGLLDNPDSGECWLDGEPVARLKENLLKAMESMDDEKFKTDLFSFSIRQASSQPLEIDETQEIPVKWCKTTVTPDKARIKEALKKGEKLGFAKLGERKQFLMIR